jgi:hypothetical protein
MPVIPAVREVLVEGQSEAGPAQEFFYVKSKAKRAGGH